MFIKRLYRYNKILFGSFLFFLAAFCIVNYKWGTVATPVTQFGMYSKHYSVKDTQWVFLVAVNGKRVDEAALSLTNRDVLQLFPEAYERQQAVNEAARSTMQRYFRFAGLGGCLTDAKFINRVTAESFWNWYRTTVEKIVGEPIQTMTVDKQLYTWNGRELTPVDTAINCYRSGTE